MVKLARGFVGDGRRWFKTTVWYHWKPDELGYIDGWRSMQVKMSRARVAVGGQPPSVAPKGSRWEKATASEAGRDQAPRAVSVAVET